MKNGVLLRKQFFERKSLTANNDGVFRGRFSRRNNYVNTYLTQNTLCKLKKRRGQLRNDQQGRSSCQEIIKIIVLAKQKSRKALPD